MQQAQHPDYMEILKLDDEELKSRLAFYELTDEDFKRLTSLKSSSKASTNSSWDSRAAGHSFPIRQRSIG